MSFAVRRTAWSMKRFRPLKRGRWWEGQTFEGSAKFPTTHHLNQELHGKTEFEMTWCETYRLHLVSGHVSKSSETTNV